MAGISLSHKKPTTHPNSGPRPVNLQTDLGALADLIETAFSSRMDSGGRSAIREMRQLSRFGVGLGVIAGLNDLAQGMSLGYVWVEAGRVVGNVSVYPANMPADMGKMWIIANVAVYPEYQGQGIATRLMQASLEMIRKRSGGRAILQVDADNAAAQHLYRKLGFSAERTFTQWRRGRYIPIYAKREPRPDHLVRVVGRRLGDSQHELALARQVRPQVRGGLDWLHPTHMHTFRLSPWQRLMNWLSLRSVQRLTVRGDQHNLIGWLQVESNIGFSHRQLYLMTHADYRDVCADALIGLAVRRFGAEGLALNHPADDETVNEIVRRYQFTPNRTVVHMRCDL